jgi:SAM-dependent methyltransferase
MDGNCLEFPDDEFDVVLNRHCDVNVLEAARVLRTNGYFVTRQVACRNTLNILEAFGWAPASFGDGWWQPVEGLAAEFRRLGCRVVADLLIEGFVEGV